MVDMVYKSGRPRTDEELIQAINALHVFIVQQVHPIMAHFPAVIEALHELIERRKKDKDVDNHHCNGVDQLGDLGCH